MFYFKLLVICLLIFMYILGYFFQKEHYLRAHQTDAHSFPPGPEDLHSCYGLVQHLQFHVKSPVQVLLGIFKNFHQSLISH